MASRPAMAVRRSLLANPLGCSRNSGRAARRAWLRSDWAERDRALLLTALLAGLRADELVRSNIGDIRVTEGGGVVNVRGKGGKDRRIPVEEGLIDVLANYLHSRASRFPGTTKRRSADATLA